MVVSPFFLSLAQFLYQAPTLGTLLKCRRLPVFAPALISRPQDVRVAWPNPNILLRDIVFPIFAMAPAVPPLASDGIPRHRACDECRSRKLACSKEADGCSRCRKEGIPCHYSPQKPMGRPRKRRHVDEDAQQSVPQELVHHDLTTGPLSAIAPQQPMATSDFQIQPSSAIDQNLSFLDETNSSNMEFWDLLPSDYIEVPTDPNLFLATGNVADATPPVPPMNLNGVDLLGSINFDEPDQSEAVSRDLGASLQRYMAEQRPRYVGGIPRGSSLDAPSFDAPSSYYQLQLPLFPLPRARQSLSPSTGGYTRHARRTQRIQGGSRCYQLS